MSRKRARLALPSRGVPERTPAEIAVMRRAGAVVAEMHEQVRSAIRPGVTLLELDAVARDVIARRGATSNFLGYHGFPAVICASVNDVVVHGIPTAQPLADGDLVSIDCGAIIDGWHGDAAWTYPVGEVSAASKRLLEVGERCLFAGIDAMKDGHRIGEIGVAVERIATDAGFEVLRGFTGHGIGQAMHERPDIPNHGPASAGPLMRVGNCFAIEPMVVAGSADVTVDDDGWTVRTDDGSWAVHFEHTIALTDNGPDILTAAPIGAPGASR